MADYTIRARSEDDELSGGGGHVALAGSQGEALALLRELLDGAPDCDEALQRMHALGELELRPAGGRFARVSCAPA